MCSIHVQCTRTNIVCKRNIAPTCKCISMQWNALTFAVEDELRVCISSEFTVKCVQRADGAPLSYMSRVTEVCLCAAPFSETFGRHSFRLWLDSSLRVHCLIAFESLWKPIATSHLVGLPSRHWLHTWLFMYMYTSCTFYMNTLWPPYVLCNFTKYDVHKLI